LENYKFTSVKVSFLPQKKNRQKTAIIKYTVVLCRQHTFQQLERHVLNNKLVPLATVAGRLSLPVSYVKFGESTGQVHDRDGNNLRLPLKTQRCTKAVTCIQTDKHKHMFHKKNHPFSFFHNSLKWWSI